MGEIKEFNMTLEQDLERHNHPDPYRKIEDMSPVEQQFVARMATLCAHAAHLEDYVHMGVEETEQHSSLSTDLVGFEESEIWERFCRRYPDYWPAVHTLMYSIYDTAFRSK